MKTKNNQNQDTKTTQNQDTKIEKLIKGTIFSFVRALLLRLVFKLIKIWYDHFFD